ncbi:[protein-PII] uridylyltransferase [Intestinicryptomonas porci]|uniref:Bifunctional uridylyltransferase/uridylyl-removing enzyme n=1 Tax=Intestinicryptomonas porci TaxID=2926320 RepID=A0ABU4WFZ2_9BACT|nr:[protein-PII] uridylyltransferase [Opitutales bacterium CLA-KB-P66]
MLSTARERLLKKQTYDGAAAIFAGKSPSAKELRPFVESRFLAIKEAHEDGASGYTVCRSNSDVIDCVISNLHALFERENAGESEFFGDFCVVALGGYGRRELCPKSDIDIMFLYSDRGVADKFKTDAIDAIMYPLWNVGYKLGHSSRTVSEALEDAQADILTKTAMLDARFICGDLNVFEDFKGKFASLSKNTAESHIEELLRLKTLRHKKYDWSPYVQEPNVKNGVGSLRDYQTLLWVAKLKTGSESLLDLARKKIISIVEYKSLRRAHALLLRTRNEMHYFSNRENDLLDLELQPKVAYSIGYREDDVMKRVERFMRDIYYSLREVDLISKTARKRMKIVLPEDIEETLGIRRDNLSKVRYFEGFIMRNGFVYAQNSAVFRKDPTLLIKVFRCCQQFGVLLSDELEILIRDSAHLIDDKVRADKAANEEFMKILRSEWNVYPILSKMHFLDILGKFIPEFGEITCLVQHEFYHRYTADIHTLNTIMELDKIFGANVEDEPYGYYHAVLSDSKNPSLLYLALLMHDLGKSDGIKGHAEVGAEIAEKILSRFDLAEDEKEIVIFLIRHHLMMARYWQSNDIEDETVIENFVEKIIDPDRLKFLYVMTFCDSKSTSSTLWNSYKQSLHTMLYRNSLRKMQSTPEKIEALYEERKQKVIDGIFNSGELRTSSKEALGYLNNLPRNYFLFHGKDDLILHMNMVHTYVERERNCTQASTPTNPLPVFEWRNDPNMSLSTVTIVTRDLGGLYFKLASAFTYAGLNILGSKAFSRADGIIIDTFYVTSVGGGAVQNERTLELFSNAILKIFGAGQDLVEQPPKRNEEFPCRILVKNSAQKTTVEVIAKDRPGLLCSITKAIYDFGFEIVFGRISVDGGWGTNNFIIKPRKDFENPSVDGLDAKIKEVL